MKTKIVKILFSLIALLTIIALGNKMVSALSDSELANLKTEAIAEITEYKANLLEAATYSKSMQKTMDSDIENAENLIDNATTKEGIDQIVADTKVTLSGLFTWEEEKADGIAQVNSIDLTLYSDENQEIIKGYQADAIEKITNAKSDTSTSMVSFYLNQFQNKLKDVQTIAEEEAEKNASFYEKYIRYTFVGRVINILITNYKLLLKGILYTLLFSIVMVGFGLVIGVLTALMRMSGLGILKGIATAYVEIIRGIPLLLQLTVIYIAFYNVVGQFWAVSIAMVLNSGAYIAEIIRSGIQAVDKGQMEAARSLGLSFGQAMKIVILPQAIKNILPALGNEFVTDIKETSLAATFTAGELMTFQKLVTGITYLTFEPAIIVAIIYFLLTFLISKLIGKLERKMKRSD